MDIETAKEILEDISTKTFANEFDPIHDHSPRIGAPFNGGFLDNLVTCCHEGTSRKYLNFGMEGGKRAIDYCYDCIEEMDEQDFRNLLSYLFLLGNDES